MRVALRLRPLASGEPSGPLAPLLTASADQQSRAAPGPRSCVANRMEAQQKQPRGSSNPGSSPTVPGLQARRDRRRPRRGEPRLPPRTAAGAHRGPGPGSPPGSRLRRAFPHLRDTSRASVSRRCCFSGALRSVNAHSERVRRVFEATTHRARRRCRFLPTNVRWTRSTDSWCRSPGPSLSTRSPCPSCRASLPSVRPSVSVERRQRTPELFRCCSRASRRVAVARLRARLEKTQKDILVENPLLGAVLECGDETNAGKVVFGDDYRRFNEQPACPKRCGGRIFYTY